jgi:hypothetical protein
MPSGKYSDCGIITCHLPGYLRNTVPESPTGRREYETRKDDKKSLRMRRTLSPKPTSPLYFPSINVRHGCCCQAGSTSSHMCIALFHICTCMTRYELAQAVPSHLASRGLKRMTGVDELASEAIRLASSRPKHQGCAVSQGCQSP